MPGGDAFTKVIQGQPMKASAEAWNTFLDTAALVKRQQEAGAQIAPFNSDACYIKVKNITGAALNQYNVVGLGNPVVAYEDNPTQFQTQPVIEAIKPRRWKAIEGQDYVTTPQDLGRFAVTQEPLDVNAIGWALVAGVTPIIVSCSVADAGIPHDCCDYADVIDDNCDALEMGAGYGAKILTPLSSPGAGSMWAIALLTQARPIQGLMKLTHNWIKMPSPPASRTKYMAVGNPFSYRDGSSGAADTSVTLVAEFMTAYGQEAGSTLYQLQRFAPNCEEGDVIPYVWREGIGLTIEAPWLYDSAIGTTAILPGATRGWALADGTANDSGHGGTGRNLCGGKLLAGGSAFAGPSGTNSIHLTTKTVFDGSGSSETVLEPQDITLNPEHITIPLYERLDNSAAWPF